MRKKRTCPFCSKTKHLTRHHWMPQKYFGKKNPFFVMMCEDCHQGEVEKLMPREKVSAVQYAKIIMAFYEYKQNERNMRNEKVSGLRAFFQKGKRRS